MLEFRNTYLLMRHGESKANVAGIVVSDPTIGCDKYGLTDIGKQQVIASAKAYSGKPITLVVHSDFKRTVETAETVKSTLSILDSKVDARLRERFFGTWEGKSSDTYEKVWAKDSVSSTQTDNGVESAQSVCERAWSVLLDLEKAHKNAVILLVSHGDTLQILSTVFHNLASGQHRTLPHHETGQIKLIASAGDCLPMAPCAIE
ncbi:histidine phosphatase family protein [Vibrio sp. S9_S30]|uniref:histidine phosphatase family protein n=1 Tax=Vibrio sp. S9_S30 TaxID=2720226 RepID=UPI0016804EE6|nr:histidine phosphatase family protein [Vibrio sp. S9_S30]MBD1557798.1 histidine phosphatase family protein [Vibrio sp. S9_S30]